MNYGFINQALNNIIKSLQKYSENTKKDILNIVDFYKKYFIKDYK